MRAEQKGTIMQHRQVGLISTISPDPTWPQEVIDRVGATHGIVKQVLQDEGFKVLDEGPLHRTYQEMGAAGRSLRARGINALVIYVGTWTYANCAAGAALERDHFRPYVRPVLWLRPRH